VNRSLATALGLSGLMLVAACTAINKATFAIEPQEHIASDEMLHGVEECFRTLGLQLQRKTDFLYPETRKESTYFLGHKELPLAMQSTYHHAVLRLEHSGTLYVDWIEITDLRRELKPESFAELHRKIATDLKTRLGIDVVFQFIPPAPQSAAAVPQTRASN
jgi:hypothetical protein